MTVDLKLWRSDAVVLFDWLMTVDLDLDMVPVIHLAEKQALADLLNGLEGYTDVPGSRRKRSTKHASRSLATWTGSDPIIRTTAPRQQRPGGSAHRFDVEVPDDSWPFGHHDHIARRHVVWVSVVAHEPVCVCG